MFCVSWDIGHPILRLSIVDVCILFSITKYLMVIKGILKSLNSLGCFICISISLLYLMEFPGVFLRWVERKNGILISMISITIHEFFLLYLNSVLQLSFINLKSPYDKCLPWIDYNNS